jgi:hypothetical protein
MLVHASVTWGLGGPIQNDCWDKWDAFVRELLEGTANYPGGSSSVFDFYLDPSRYVHIQGQLAMLQMGTMQQWRQDS